MGEDDYRWDVSVFLNLLIAIFSVLNIEISYLNKVSLLISHF